MEIITILTIIGVVGYLWNKSSQSRYRSDVRFNSGIAEAKWRSVR